MIDFLVWFFTNKQVFTYVILALYASNTLFQILVTRDYIWGGYWFSAAMITFFAMSMSNRGG